MSSQVEQMMSVRQVPWHGIGKIVQDAPTAKEAIELAGLNWGVEEWHIEGRKPSTELYASIPTHKLLLRSDTLGQLGVVGVGYKPLQNSEAFSFFDPFVESKECSFETAGCLQEGRRVWILAKLNRAPIEITKDDVVDKFLLLSNGHDGTMAVRVGFTPVRVVCSNTLAMAHNNERSELIRITHGKKVLENLNQVREIINAADAKFEATAEQYRALLVTGVNQEEIKKFVKIIFKINDQDSERKTLRYESITRDITRLFEAGAGNDLPKVRGTYWALYNAYTEYLTHEKRSHTGNEGRLSNLWFGFGVKDNQHALEVALKMSAA